MAASRARGPVWLTDHQAAERIGVSRRTLYRRRDEWGLFPVQLSPGVARYDLAEVDRFIARKRREARPRDVSRETSEPGGASGASGERQ